ncbi:uncharacterized protein LOC127877299 isoform X3 [Dreissena polymorpha]|uniref:uncharacterized protein LOC127877299 isoform X3 n=1 Tax=Dreissena polymorpha TaxID=45954 RepID=UPI002264AE8D|nr:uncharacterized protein LOC127877299 isoform X3 [Dreissena polymorpha]
MCNMDNNLTFYSLICLLIAPGISQTDVCLHYKILNKTILQTDNTLLGHVTIPVGWYRYTGTTSGVIATSCPTKRNACGAINQVWIEGALPTFASGIQQISACVRTDESSTVKCCGLRNKLDIAKCNGFFVYHLTPSGPDIHYCFNSTAPDLSTETMPNTTIPPTQAPTTTRTGSSTVTTLNSAPQTLQAVSALISRNRTTTACILCGVQSAPGGVTRAGGNGHLNASLCSLQNRDTDTISGSCDFNRDKCGYSFPPNLWYIHSENFGGLIYGKIPGDDHGQDQTFANFQSNDPKVNDTDRVGSSILSPLISSEHVCLKFWFLMPNQNSRLEVYVVTSGDNASSLVFDNKYKPASQWKEVQLEVSSAKPFQIKFESVKENNYGYVGLDHIQVLVEKVITTTTTTTTQLPTTSILTMLTTTSEIPTTTINTTTKHFPTTTTASPTSSTDTPSTTTTPTKIMPTTTTPTPIMLTTTTPTTIMLTTTTASTMPVITTTAATAQNTTSAGPCSCNCPTVATVCAGSQTTPKSTPAPTVCDRSPDQLSVQSQYSCSFDAGLCGYSLPVYPHLWDYIHFRYGNASIGEIVGDASPGGAEGYLVFNTNNYHVQNQTSHALRSPELQPFIEYCLSFRYNMPTNVSNLRVYMNYALSHNRTAAYLAYRVENMMTSGWKQVKVALRASDRFTLEFKSTKFSELGFLGLDGITVSIVPVKPHIKRSVDSAPARSTRDLYDPTCACTCPTARVIDCDTATMEPQYHSCSDITDAILQKKMSCDFDDGTGCNFDVPTYPRLWDLVRYRYGNESVGEINGDSSSTDGSGVYAVFTTDDHYVQPGDSSEIKTPIFSETGKFCLGFKYNMPTEDAMLSVFSIVGGVRRQVWSASHPTSGWVEATVILNSNQTLQIAFSSTKKSEDSYFGIDDVRLYSNVNSNV